MNNSMEHAADWEKDYKELFYRKFNSAAEFSYIDVKYEEVKAFILSEKEKSREEGRREAVAYISEKAVTGPGDNGLYIWSEDLRGALQPSPVPGSKEADV